MVKIFRKDTDKLSFYAKNIATIMTFFRVFSQKSHYFRMEVERPALIGI